MHSSARRRLVLPPTQEVQASLLASSKWPALQSVQEVDLRRLVSPPLHCKQVGNPPSLCHPAMHSSLNHGCTCWHSSGASRQCLSTQLPGHSFSPFELSHPQDCGQKNRIGVCVPFAHRSRFSSDVISYDDKKLHPTRPRGCGSPGIKSHDPLTNARPISEVVICSVRDLCCCSDGAMPA